MKVNRFGMSQKQFVQLLLDQGAIRARAAREARQLIVDQNFFELRKTAIALKEWLDIMSKTILEHDATTKTAISSYSGVYAEIIRHLEQREAELISAPIS